MSYLHPDAAAYYPPRPRASRRFWARYRELTAADGAAQWHPCSPVFFRWTWSDGDAICGPMAADDIRRANRLAFCEADRRRNGNRSGGKPGPYQVCSRNLRFRAYNLRRHSEGYCTAVYGTTHRPERMWFHWRRPLGPCYQLGARP